MSCIFVRSKTFQTTLVFRRYVFHYLQHHQLCKQPNTCLTNALNFVEQESNKQLRLPHIALCRRQITVKIDSHQTGHNFLAFSTII